MANSTPFRVKPAVCSVPLAALFPVERERAIPVSAPCVEAIMVDTSLNQGIAFSRPARVLEENRQTPLPSPEEGGGEGNQKSRTYAKRALDHDG